MITKSTSPDPTPEQLAFRDMIDSIKAIIGNAA